MIRRQHRAECILGRLILRGKRSLHARVFVVPEQVEGRADGCDSLLPPLEDNEKMNPFVNRSRYLRDEVALRGEHVVPRQIHLAFFLGVDQEAGAELLEAGEREFHSTFRARVNLVTSAITKSMFRNFLN